jgi:bifunctional non-homologous end joining protein LigD
MPSSRSRSTPADPLAPYRHKRDFSRTKEPSGTKTPADSGAGSARFVVQRHRASRLHYDFRLEIDGVLVSWAVPKGPTLDPGVRRAAFHVEDHPLDYFDFEGVIPAGEYGGGDVIVWDAGTWEPHDLKDAGDPRGAVAGGELHLDMYGEKLRGRFIMVRTRTDDSGKEQWLLLHKHDEFASDGWNAEDHPQSVLSGRTNDEVKADPDRLWRSDLPAARASLALKPETIEPPNPDELAALDDLKTAGTWPVFGRDLRVTNLNRKLFPGRTGEQPVSKRELLRYAAQVAPTVLPYLTRRAIHLHRFPDGARSKGSWQRAVPQHAPDWLPRWDDPAAGRGAPKTYLVVDEPAALVWAANLDALEWRVSTAPVDDTDHPSYALIVLDSAGPTEWDDVLALARLYRTAFEHLDLVARPLLTGAGGIQLWVPIAPGPTVEEIGAWVGQLAMTVDAVAPELAAEAAPTSRPADARTHLAPYSPRAAAGAPVITPIEWAELDDPQLPSDGFTIHTVLDRIDEKGDPFRDLLKTRQRLPRLG